MIKKVFGSILSCDVLSMQSEIDRLVRMGIKGLHLDLMDGHFVERVFLGEDIINRIVVKNPDMFVECHLMVSSPLNSIKHLDISRIDRIVVHQREKLPEISEYIGSSGCKLGLAVVNEKEIEGISSTDKLKIDKILIMGVPVGEGGQKMLSKTKEMIEFATRRHKDLLIGVDGGVNLSTLGEVQLADEIVLGSCLFSENGEETARKIFSYLGL
ncbi:ribulose-phosphate 3-epimerase [Nematocida minor]|uniref:ribulose-phosphate 3-epimerase n=1 Tax=Nematocida minor TaxID=1912983 RepID=UPI00221FB6A9|nr:ribulose-phosphate 3-epimerase [Nematocida minor]KAI5190052.1 ribulose-phosphate 3-epimerase [Nematocida minor]